MIHFSTYLILAKVMDNFSSNEQFFNANFNDFNVLELLKKKKKL